MQHETHSDLSILRHHFNAWRKANQFSRETAVQLVVEAHEQGGFDIASNIRFEPPTRDAFERMRVNADRVTRWLDDETKENNLLPFNFHKSILAALPLSYRAAAMNDMYRCIGIAVHAIDVEEGELNINHHLCDIVKETGEAVQAVAQLHASTDHTALLRADKEAAEAVESLSKFRRVLAKAIEKSKKVAQVFHVKGRK